MDRWSLSAAMLVFILWTCNRPTAAGVDKRIREHEIHICISHPLNDQKRVCLIDGVALGCSRQAELEVTSDEGKPASAANTPT